MVFLGGPRQVGKTTFAQSLIKNFKDGHSAYLNWDSREDRQIILNGGWPASEKLIVLDEIHKYSKWRGLIKGYFDKLKNTHNFLVTGSARLDYYRKSGDSLLGRYHYYRMHPFSVSEVGDKSLQTLLKFGGFPEVYLKQEERKLKRWHLERKERIIYSDIRDLEQVKEITDIELLASELPYRVGSPLSRKNLSNELEKDFKTIERWITILENVYYCFRILPFGSPRIKAVKKEQKLYLWDWSEHEDIGKRWENFVASHLLKYCHFIQDTEGDRMELRFLRDVTGREIDFVVIRNKKPIFAVECKAGEKSVSKNINYFLERTNIPHFFQVHLGTRDIAITDSVRLLPFQTFAKIVGLV